jgi:hypothetical protein
MTKTLRPLAARAAAKFTVEVVLPTPPFWLETEITRVFRGFGRAVASIFFSLDED